MKFYHDKDSVRKYIEMSKDYQVDLLIDTLRKLLPEGSNVLEIGMGPGIDFDKLSNYFSMTGSDESPIFIELYRQRNEEAKLLLVDARELCLDEAYDGIYSNKVLVHLSKEELKHSIRRQYEVVSDGGVIIHSFWRGSGSSHEGGVDHYYYEDQELIDIFSQYFTILMVHGYSEIEEHDSVMVVAKKKERGIEE